MWIQVLSQSFGSVVAPFLSLEIVQGLSVGQFIAITFVFLAVIGLFFGGSSDD